MRFIGVPELLVFLVFGLIFYLVPIVAALWALFTLRRVRSAQELMQGKLEAIEQQLQARK